MKQYKNGLKLAKQILTNPKYTEHGETLAMKGLTLNCLGRKDEAYEHVRRGLRNDLKSHVCWHVYGLLQRSDKKYDEAIKCYRNALKCEKDNIQILRDLSLLQIQMRDLEGYRETRHQLFKLRPSQHASWIGFAMSYHLMGDFETANAILDTFRQSQQLNETHDYKHSELLLYQNQILQESGNIEKARKHLLEFSSQIVDKLAVKETMGELCLKLGEYSTAIPIWEDLIKRNPENSLYYKKYLEAKQVVDVDEIVNIYKKFQAEYPYSICPKRLPLNVATGDRFKEIVDEYLRRGLRKGIPPLFVNIRSIYDDEEKVKIISDLIHDYHANLKATCHFSKADADAILPAEPASALLWTLYFLSQHFDHLRDSTKALEYIDAAIEHTPTLIELFVAKGRIYKHAGNLVEAFKWLDEGQSLDTADRYINSKCAKYMLRANMIKLAEEVCAKFTREDVSAMENLNEMQCMWFQTECALAYQRLEKWGDSLKKCHEVDRHFSEIIEDQFDFHTYCMRKMTLRAYVGLLRLEDVLRKHPFYFKAARCAIEVYVRLYDKPLKIEQHVEEFDIENLAPAELKKLRNKQRRAKKKAEQVTAQSVQAQVRKDQHNKSRQQQSADGDPEAPQLDELVPDKLERPDDPLEKAVEFLRPLQILAKDCIKTHLLAFEIYYRKNKLLLMLQSIKRARSIDASNAILHSCIIKFHKALKEQLADINESVCTVIDKETTILFDGKDAHTLNQIFLQKYAKSVHHVLQVAQSMYELDVGKRVEAIKLVTSHDISNLTLEDVTEVYTYLTTGIFGPCDSYAAEYKEKCHLRFPHANLFKDATPSENYDANDVCLENIDEDKTISAEEN